eukprot:TRINITY_DN2258_c0_g1_i1.p1 TRINITY_DN2258_c0_g1~~TRINITY_DN2258_c0_g1_i1.p1  ORF type:complete len:191 (+),score=17.42 TRINITY_DN2258_c0_g1_i1:50-574(+)
MSARAYERARILFQHLGCDEATFKGSLCSEKTIDDIDVKTLNQIILRISKQDMETREKVIKLFEDPDFTLKWDMHYQEFRSITLKQLKKIISHKLLDACTLRDDPTKFLTIFEVISYNDSSLSTKMGVHFSLFGSAIVNLGTERHQKYLNEITEFTLPGNPSPKLKFFFSPRIN